MSDQDDDFATLFEASITATRFERGQTVDGTIVTIGPEVALVSVGAKGEASIATAELKDDDGQLEVAVGDRIQATIVSTAGGLTLSRRLQRGAATMRQLEDAFHAGLPVDGKVEKSVKGGYEVRVARQRAFCPISQIDLARTSDPAVHEGRVYTFKIVEFKEGGRNLVVSRRALLEEEQKAKAEEIRRSIAPGAIVTGRVVSVRDFGAFVDLGGGVQGLLHVSEMGWSRVSAASVVAVGDEITVKVLRVDEGGPPPPTRRQGSPERLQREGGQKIALGLKQLSDDPWSTVQATYEVGQVREGRVTRVAEFGVFVELEPGVEGLAHASTFPPTGGSRGWARAVPVGTTGAFEILSIDLDKKRIGVALVPDGAVRASVMRSSSEIVPGARITGKVERIEPFGVFVFLAPGRTALMPMSETGVDKEADIAKAFPIGGDVDVIVLDADAASRRIRVSRKAVLAAQDADEMREYRERNDTTASGSLGSLADKLRNALAPRQK